MEPNGITYPLPELLTGLGFFIILFIERLVQICRDRSEQKYTNDEKDKKFEKSSTRKLAMRV
jgi:hypothetical protein